MHRNLKPADIFVTKDGRIKLLDFGLAEPASQPGSADAIEPLSHALRARAAKHSGTAAYLAPSRSTGSSVDHRADLFALGCMLYEMFAGRSPFGRASLIESMNATLADDPRSGRTLIPR